jgi:hypothetical protein
LLIQSAAHTGIFRPSAGLTDRADVARRLGFTRARITHLLDLPLLAPDIQELVLGFVAVDGPEPMSERTLRAVARVAEWPEQRRLFTAERVIETQRA